jgi:hypothetical protein
VGALMEWVAGLGLNLASAGVWEAIRCAYDLCTQGLLDRQAAAEVLTAAARQVPREGRVGEAHAPAADRFWEAFCRHLLHTLTPDQLPAYLFRPDAAAVSAADAGLGQGTGNVGDCQPEHWP